jgi:hypothetical protein
MICPLVPVEESPTGYKFLEITLSSIALKGFLAENRRAILVSSSLKSPSSAPLGKNLISQPHQHCGHWDGYLPIAIEPCVAR